VDKLIDQGYMDFGILRVLKRCRNQGEWIPQPRATWVALPGKRRSSGVMTNKTK
jgi:hypothetical protein